VAKLSARGATVRWRLKLLKPFAGDSQVECFYALRSDEVLLTRVVVVRPDGARHDCGWKVAAMWPGADVRSQLLARGYQPA
jgi:hypothetical protein